MSLRSNGVVFGVLMSIVALPTLVDEIDDFVGHPFADVVAASPASGRVAWTERDHGKRSIWTWNAKAPGATPQKLVEYPDDGQPISALQVSGAGTRIAFVRGGEANAQGFAPNPALTATGVEQAVWVIAASGGPVTRIGAGHAPALSPDGTQMAWLAEGKLLLRAIEADGKEDTKPAFKQRGPVSEFRWSPDGSRIAFVSDRGDHSFVGLYERATQHLRFIGASVDRDIAPRFSADGKRVAFLREPGARNGEVLDITAGIPFAVMVADLATGDTRELWHSPGADGGFAKWVVREPLGWIGSERVVFYSEHDGWLRLWAIGADSKRLTALSPPNCEVEDWSVAPDAKDILLSDNCAAIDGRQLQRVDLASGKVETVTGGEAIQTDPFDLGGGTFVSRSADARAPMAVVYGEAGTHRILGPARNRVVLDRMVVPKGEVVSAADGTSIHVQVFDAGDGKPQKPALIYLHGGPIRQMLPGFHYMDYYHQAYAMNQHFARQGYVVVSVNYRSGIGYGRAFRQAPKQGPRGASEYQDVLAGVQYLRQRKDVDRARVGIWGGSYGGLLTAQALARNSDLFAAGVDFHGVHDWSEIAKKENGALWGIVGDDAMKLAHESSPLADVDGWRSPVLLIHGDADANVPFSQTVDLALRLRAQKVEVETLVFPDDDHDISLYANWLTAYRAADRFLATRLKP